MGGERAAIRAARTGILFRLSPILVPFAALFLGGFVLACAQSLGFMAPIPLPGDPWRAYAEVFTDSWFWASFGFTVYVAASSALLSVAAGSLFAYGIWKLPARWQGSAVVYKVPLVLPHIAVGFVVLILFTQSGFLASAGHSLGLVEGLRDFPAVLYSGNGLGLILAYTYKGTGFVILMAYAILKRLDPRQITMARMLGAGRLRIYHSVVLPHLAPVLHTCFIILFLYSFGAFDIPFLLSESYPGMLSIRAFNLFFRRDLSNRPEAMAILVVMFLFAGLFIILYTRVVDRLQSGERKL
ncbi:MAG: ABC transporter permease [Desulfatibacillaceae bacterium]